MANTKIADPTDDANLGVRVSEESSITRKPGRPPRWPRDMVEQGRFVKPGASKRTHQNTALAMFALYALRDEPASWFYGGRQAATRGDNCIKWAVVEALGRIVNEEEILHTARQLAAMPPMRVKDAVRLIRSMRGTDRPTPGTSQGAVEAMRIALNNYMTTHPMEWDDVSLAVKILAVAVRDAQVIVPEAP